MNAENNCQSLIADIDRLLAQAHCETTRQTLERVRTYLVSSDDSTISQAVNLMAQQILAQINYKLNDWLEALQIELMAHRQERQALLADIEQLQQQRQKILTEFLAALMSRTQEALQQPSEQFLITLETNLQTVFTTLEKDLQGYYESLAQGLERMHYLGQQGEAKLIAYVHRLSQQLEQTPEIEIKVSQAQAYSSLNTIPNSQSQILNPTPPADSSLSTIQNPKSKIQNQTKWYLGIDINPLGLAAVLLKQELTHAQEYPLVWEVEGETVFRLPKSQQTETLSFLKQSHANIPVKTAQLSEDLLKQVLEQLEGVCVHCEAEIVEAIPNIRANWIQAILAAQWVNKAEQIVFVEGAIATLLSHLSPGKTQTTGTTLVIYGGIFSTQLALVEMPAQVQSLSWETIKLTHWTYGDRNLDQDILCQLIYPQWISAFAVSLPQLTIPQAGTPDVQTRQILTTQLDNHPLGQSLLEAAKLAKLILGHQTALTSQLINHSWTVQRQDLEKQVIFPYLQKLESAIISFLTQHHQSVEDIRQIICNGELILSLENSVSRTLDLLFPRKPLILVAQREPIGQIVRGTACLPLFPSLFNSRENMGKTSV